MMRIGYTCRACGNDVQTLLPEPREALTCPVCRASTPIAADALEGDAVRRCPLCAGTELFVRKDFPQRLGVSIVVLGFAISCVTWFFHQVVWTFCVLFLTAAIDVILYLFMGDVLECYRCHARFRGADDLQRHAPFALEIHEKYRQRAARINEVAEGQISRPS